MFKILRNIGLITLLAVPYAQAKIYSWVDANGKTHFSDISTFENAIELDIQVPLTDLSVSPQSQKPLKNDNKGTNQSTSNQKVPPLEQQNSGGE